MQSTSALLNSSAPQMSYKQSSRHNTSGAQISFRALRTTSAAQVQTVGAQGGVSAGSLSSGSNSGRTYSAGSTGTAGMTTISLPALSITEKNIASAARTFTADEEEENLGITPRPRRIEGEGGEDNPTDPYINGNYTPIGDAPWWLVLLFALCYIAFRAFSTIRPRRSKS